MICDISAEVLGWDLEQYSNLTGLFSLSTLTDMTLEGRDWQPTHFYRESACVMLWNVYYSAGIIDAIKVSLEAHRYMLGGEITIAEQHGANMFIALLGAGAHDAALCLLHYSV